MSGNQIFFDGMQRLSINPYVEKLTDEALGHAILCKLKIIL